MNITDDIINADIKPIVISAVIILNITVNTLAIAVLVRYPELREDRTALFMMSLSLSDLAAGCLPMPISAAVCSSATPSVRHTNNYLPELHMFFTWCFSFNSLHSLCWLTLCKMVTLLKPLRHEQIFTRRRSYGIIVCNWIVGAAIAASRLGMGATWNIVTCTFELPKNNAISAITLLTYAFVALLPAVVLVYSTLRILVVVTRVHKDIATQVHAVDGIAGSAGHVTLKAIRSAKNIVIICVVSVVFALPVLAAVVLRHATDNQRFLRAIGFASFWIFNCNSFMNSLLYLLLYRSVRKKFKLMFTDVY